MLKRYNIWDKSSQVITPSGAIFTPEEWIAKYPVAGIDGMDIVCGSGIINGSYFGVLPQMVAMYESQGHDFSNCTTAIEKLERIEEIEDELNQPIEDNTISDQTRIADALQDLVALQMDDVIEEE